MATQGVVFDTITVPTTLRNKSTITLINQSDENGATLTIEGQATNISLGAGQTLELSASTGFTLPDIAITGTDFVIDIITS